MRSRSRKSLTRGNRHDIAAAGRSYAETSDIRLGLSRSKRSYATSMVAARFKRLEFSFSQFLDSPPAGTTSGNRFGRNFYGRDKRHESCSPAPRQKMLDSGSGNQLY
jgi:hypothetical protein